jgi:hypothetical protein
MRNRKRSLLMAYCHSLLNWECLTDGISAKDFTKAPMVRWRGSTSPKYIYCALPNVERSGTHMCMHCQRTAAIQKTETIRFWKITLQREPTDDRTLSHGYFPSTEVSTSVYINGVFFWYTSCIPSPRTHGKIATNSKS